MSKTNDTKSDDKNIDSGSAAPKGVPGTAKTILADTSTKGTNNGKIPEMKALELPVLQQDPYNRQAVKEFVFNETGNIMMATTEIGSQDIEQSVRDVFAEVSVFFAAMTRAMTTTINPATGKFYTVYDYAAIEGIVGGSGLFVQVSEEDITHTMKEWGATVSKELIEGILGLATGEGELAFAQGLISSIGKRGLEVGGSSDKTDGKVGTIVFVCEYLLGMPIISALVVYIDAKKHYQQLKVGPCIKEHSSSLSLEMHKDTYLFVTPKFIRQYSGDLLSIETELEFQELVAELQDLVERRPTIAAVETFPDGERAPGALTEGTPYAMVGTFLNPGPEQHPVEAKVIAADGTPPTIEIGARHQTFMTFTVKGERKEPAVIGLYKYVEKTKGNWVLEDTPFVTTPRAFSVVKAQ
jgi:hypothetical protein